MSAPQPWTGIQIETSFFPLSFILYACTPTIIIDGHLTRRPWGTHNFPTAGHAQREDLFPLFVDGDVRRCLNQRSRPTQLRSPDRL